MRPLSRRRFLKASSAFAATTVLTPPSIAQQHSQQLKFTPEPRAKLRVLRWKRFVQGDEEAWLANTKKFQQMTGVEVIIDAEDLEQVRSKAAVAANIGSGPDIIIGYAIDAHQYPDKLIE